MSIAELGAIGEFTGSIAVFLTLLYLVAEIRLTRKATMAQIYQLRADAASNARTQFGGSPSAALAILKFRRLVDTDGVAAAVAALTESELAHAVFYFSAQIHRIDNIHYQFQNGLVDDELFEATVRGGIRESGRIWQAFGLLDSQRASFLAEVESVLAETGDQASEP